jgi:hypothetical protein
LTRRLRVHAERELVPPDAGHAAFLEPIWGPTADKYDDPRSPLAGRFDSWRAQGAALLEEAPLDEADVAVLASGWEHYARVEERRAAAHAYAERARSASVPLVVFYLADSTEPLQLPGAHVFRTSVLRSVRGEREYALPAFTPDVGLDPRPWGPRPVVGFCGYAPDIGAWGAVRRAARRVLDHPPHPGYVRTRACGILLRSHDVETNFVFRSAYWAGTSRPDGTIDYEGMRSARSEFVGNMLESDYVLAVRGGGNFSIRLYEALSAGRIPIFVDTDTVLPCWDAIDWRSLCVWLDESELPDLAARVATFHGDAGPKGFAERQRACRSAYVEHLAPEAWFRALVPRLFLLQP